MQKAKVGTKKFHSTQSPAVIATVSFVNPLAYIGRVYLADPKEIFKLCIFLNSLTLYRLE